MDEKEHQNLKREFPELHEIVNTRIKKPIVCRACHTTDLFRSWSDGGQGGVIICYGCGGVHDRETGKSLPSLAGKPRENWAAEGLLMVPRQHSRKREHRIISISDLSSLYHDLYMSSQALDGFFNEIIGPIILGKPSIAQRIDWNGMGVKPKEVISTVHNLMQHLERVEGPPEQDMEQDSESKVVPDPDEIEENVEFLAEVITKIDKKVLACLEKEHGFGEGLVEESIRCLEKYVKAGINAQN